MFGIIYAVTNGILRLIGAGIEAGENAEAREKARCKGEITYLGHAGKEYLTSTGERVVTGHNSNGDRVIKRAKDMKVIRNLTSEELHQETLKNIELAKKYGQTVYEIPYKNKPYQRPYEDIFFDKYVKKESGQYRFKDLKNGSIYVVGFLTVNPHITFKSYRLNCFVDVNTDMYIRPTDSQIDYLYKKNKLNSATIKEINVQIEERNKERIKCKNSNIECDRDSIYFENQGMLPRYKQDLPGDYMRCPEKYPDKVLIWKELGGE